MGNDELSPYFFDARGEDEGPPDGKVGRKKKGQSAGLKGKKGSLCAAEESNVDRKAAHRKRICQKQFDKGL